MPSENAYRLAALRIQVNEVDAAAREGRTPRSLEVITYTAMMPEFKCIGGVNQPVYRQLTDDEAVDGLVKWASPIFGENEGTAPVKREGND